MRPKKKVLVYGTDEAEISGVGYVLWTRCMAPLVAATEAGAIGTARATDIDCAVVLCRDSRLRCEQFLAELHQARPEMPIVLMLAAADARPSVATIVLPRFDTALLMETVRTMCRRKRGPKKAGAGYQVKNVDLIASKLQRVG